MSYGYRFSCKKCKINRDLFFLITFPWREYEDLACSNCKKIFSSDGSRGGFLLSKTYKVLYRNKKNTKWIIYKKDDQEKLGLIKKGICPECKKKLVNLNKEFKKLKKEKIISCFFCRKKSLLVKPISAIS